MKLPTGFERANEPLAVAPACWSCHRRATRAARAAEVIGLRVGWLCPHCAGRSATRAAFHDAMRIRLEGWPLTFTDGTGAALPAARP